jgi:hypothetical protein
MASLKQTAAVSAVLISVISGYGRAQSLIRYIEPAEHAYSIEVPRNWSVHGGIQRRSITQPHSVVQLQSPGGQTFMLLGNPQAISYSTPTPMGMMMGFRPGSFYAPNGDPLIIQPYLSGLQFALTTGRGLLQQGGCGNVQVIESREKPAPATTIAGLPETRTAGEVVLRCERNGITYDAYMFSQTEMFGAPQGNVGAVWNADSSYFVVTPSGQLNEAGVLLTRIITSVRMDPQWVAQQLHAAGASVAATAHRLDQALAAQAQSMRQSFSSAEADRAASQDEMDRLISGFDSYKDSAGNLHTVPYPSDATGWYTNGLGGVAGTRTGQGAGPGWTPMTRVPTGQ